MSAARRPPPLVAALPGNERLAEALARGLDADRLALAVRHFPDGESYVRVETECRGRDTVVACTLDRPDEKTLALTFVAETLRDLGARRVVLVAPYLAYMRQDARFVPGEGVTARYFARLLSDRFDGLVTVDPHLHRLASLDEVYQIPYRVARASPAVTRWILEHVREPLLVGPDHESEQWVADAAAEGGLPYVVFEKVRSGDREVRVSAPDLSLWKERTPVVLDDIVSSGHTMIEAVGRVRQAGLPPPVLIAIHGVLAEGAEAALTSCGAARLLTTNTIAHETNAIDVHPALAAATRELLAGR
jgi:ribose-phosphate pyrophosphokinase